VVWSLIVGNGLTIDAAQHCGIEMPPSHPWDWPIMNPYQPEEPLLNAMPRLQAHLTIQGVLSELTVYDALDSIVRDTQTRPPLAPGEAPTDQDFIHMEACHFLRHAYAWYTEQFDIELLKSWKWCEWLIQNGPNVETILSYNYDTVLERVLRLASLGKVYGGTQQNSPLSPEPPEIYVEAIDGDRCVIHVAKPHGSCNFSGWGRRQCSDENGIKPLYPIEGVFACRDGTLRILEGPEIHEPAHVADLVLPGEWSCWDTRESTRVEWAAKHKEIFIEESRLCQKLLVVGFGYGEPDRPEFDDLLDRMNHFNEVHIVHPKMTPPREFLSSLESKICQKVTIWSGPQMLISA
jgi:hypothetical protein